MSRDWFQLAFGAHYPVLYAHRDAAEAARCLDLLPGLAPLTTSASRPVLDLGCGDGRHLALLAERGTPAVGLDLSPHLLLAARGRVVPSGPLSLVRGDMRRLPIADGALGGVLSLFTAFGYFSSEADNQKPVNEISRVLQSGAHWFLDYLDGDAVRGELEGGEPSARRREAGPLVVEETRFLAPAGDRVVKDVTLTPRAGAGAEAAALGVGVDGLTYRESVALFTLEELDAMAERAGLERVAAAGGYEGQPLGSGTRWILVYRRGPEGEET